jgi:hypothetical protein
MKGFEVLIYCTSQLLKPVLVTRPLFVFKSSALVSPFEVIKLAIKFCHSNALALSGHLHR